MLARDLLIYIGQIIKSPGILFPFNYIYIYIYTFRREFI